MQSIITMFSSNIVFYNIIASLLFAQTFDFNVILF